MGRCESLSAEWRFSAVRGDRIADERYAFGDDSRGNWRIEGSVGKQYRVLGKRKRRDRVFGHWQTDTTRLQRIGDQPRGME